MMNPGLEPPPHRRSDDDALVEVFRRDYEPLMRLAFVLTGNQQESEDLVQEAFADLHRRWDRVLNPAGYLRSAVVNGAKRRGRRATNRRRITDENRRRIAGETTKRPTYDHYLTDALSRLPKRHRTALVLAYFGGYSSPEIAEVMNCRPGTARSLVHRGLRLLAGEVNRD